MKRWQSESDRYVNLDILALTLMFYLVTSLLSLFAWKRPTASFHAILLLSILIPASLFLANIVLLKLAQVGFGVLMFVVIPIVARMERYEPLAWTLGDAPTDAECE